SGKAIGVPGPEDTSRGIKQQNRKELFEDAVGRDRQLPLKSRGGYEISWGRILSMPSFLMRLRRVFGWSPRMLAAPRGPSTTPPVDLSAARMCERSSSSSVRDPSASTPEALEGASMS